MYWDYEKYAREAIEKNFPELEQEEIKNKYTKLLNKADNAVRDLVKRIFDESADDYLRDVWYKIAVAIKDDMCGLKNLRQCGYLDNHAIKDIMEKIYENNKGEIYNHILTKKDENILDLIEQLAEVEKENEQLKEQLYGNR